MTTLCPHCMRAHTHLKRTTRVIDYDTDLAWQYHTYACDICHGEYRDIPVKVKLKDSEKIEDE